MNNENKTVTELKKKLKTFMIVFIILEIISFLFFFVVFSFLSEFEREGIGSAKYMHPIVMIAIPALSVIADTAFYISFKKKIKLASEVQPVQCAVEDFLIISYMQDRRRKYRLIPIVKNPATNDLLCTFGKYSMSVYTTVQAKNAATLRFVNIIRNDSSSVEVGDTVQVYIRRFVNVNVRLKADNTYYFDNNKYMFEHENQNYDITILQRLKFFEGMVDVEPQ